MYKKVYYMINTKVNKFKIIILILDSYDKIIYTLTDILYPFQSWYA
jgi:hypothetical protein